jgi:hypothetical protein
MSDSEPYAEKSIQQILRWCNHFNGIQHDVCKAGLKYQDVRTAKEPNGGYAYPCLKDPGAVTCSMAEFKTREEAEEDYRESIARVTAYFEAIKRGECPTHKRAVKLRQVGSCVYGDCGCRLYQGKVPR